MTTKELTLMLLADLPEYLFEQPMRITPRAVGTPTSGHYDVKIEHSVRSDIGEPVEYVAHREHPGFDRYGEHV
jgi:hypothetical protein